MATFVTKASCLESFPFSLFYWRKLVATAISEEKKNKKKHTLEWRCASDKLEVKKWPIRSLSHSTFQFKVFPDRKLDWASHLKALPLTSPLKSFRCTGFPLKQPTAPSSILSFRQYWVLPLDGTKTIPKSSGRKMQNVRFTKLCWDEALEQKQNTHTTSQGNH